MPAIVAILFKIGVDDTTTVAVLNVLLILSDLK
jgi:hypothetical protein